MAVMKFIMERNQVKKSSYLFVKSSEDWEEVCASILCIIILFTLERESFLSLFMKSSFGILMLSDFVAPRVFL